ncbi:chemotaxis response regulator protein-glutamate methylesterase [bacterium]|nr:MAG: chemotaxis response regulator protein-glutamate methylesterase [bacterium]
MSNCGSGASGMKERIRVLVVDDSAFMRRALLKMLENDPSIEVIGTANSGEEGVERVAALRPDVVTMDVEMPGIGGLEAVRSIMLSHPTPIIMISSVTREGAEETLRALELGAVDFIPKPTAAYMDILHVARDLVAKVRAVGGSKRPLTPPPAALAAPVQAPSVPSRPAAGTMPPVLPTPRLRAGRVGYEVVTLGTSTGGPVALSQVVPALPADLPVPLIIVQHMPPGFTRPLAERLNGASQLTVLEGEDGMPLRAGTAIVAPAGRQLAIVRGDGGWVCRLYIEPSGHSLHVPSVDHMMSSAAAVFHDKTIGVIMTGMGQDGLEGLKRIKAEGGYVVGQDEASCIVYGMPRAAALAGVVDRVVPLGGVARAIVETLESGKQ